MPFVQKPVAFDSINFLPGFPSLSRFGCNPWNTGKVAGSCPDGPVNISREPIPVPASQYIARAMLQAGVAPPAYNNMFKRGIVPGQLAGIMAQLRGIGNPGGSGDGGSIGDGNTGPTRLGGLGGCGCGGSCGCGGHDHGLGFALTDITSDPLGWLQSNAVPLAIGGALVFFLFKRR